jgi:deoxyguanosine kinase
MSFNFTNKIELKLHIKHIVESIIIAMVQLYSIEGNIGSGKSTLVKMLQASIGDDPRFLFLDEPVTLWNTIKDKSGETMISKFYADQKKYSFPFQMMAYITRISLLRKAMREHPDKIIISERSVFTDKNVFVEMLYASGMIEEVEYQIYLRWFNEFLEEINLAGIIYVKASPETSHSRVLKRAREGEDIPLSYLEGCHDQHEKWLLSEKSPLLLINADPVKEETTSDYSEWISQIEKFIDQTSDKTDV